MPNVQVNLRPAARPKARRSDVRLNAGLGTGLTGRMHNCQLAQKRLRMQWTETNWRRCDDRKTDVALGLSLCDEAERVARSEDHRCAAKSVMRVAATKLHDKRWRIPIWCLTYQAKRPAALTATEGDDTYRPVRLSAGLGTADSQSKSTRLDRGQAHCSSIPGTELMSCAQASADLHQKRLLGGSSAFCARHPIRRE